MSTPGFKETVIKIAQARRLQDVAEGADLIAARHRQGQGVVRLIASASAINGMLVSALTSFGERAPSVEVHLREAEGDDQLLAIARGEADLVACRRPSVIPEGWEFVPRVDDVFAVICAAEHPLARARRVGWAELTRQLWVLVPAGTSARERFDAFATHFPAAPQSHPLVTRNPALLVRLLQQRQALCLLPLSFVRHRIEDGELAVVKTREVMTMLPLGLLRPAAPSDATARLAECLIQAAGA